MAESPQVRKAGRRGAVTRGTANVFADLGFPNAVERQVKLRLAYALNQLLAGRQVSLFEAVKVLGITQHEGAALRRYKLAGLSVGFSKSCVLGIRIEGQLPLGGSSLK